MCGARSAAGGLTECAWLAALLAARGVDVVESSSASVAPDDWRVRLRVGVVEGESAC